MKDLAKKCSCGKELKGAARKFCQSCYWKTLKGRKLSDETRRKMSASRTGEKNYGWKGGRSKTSHGYIRIKIDNHPYSDCNGYIYEHRYVVEQKINRYLEPNEEVHHVNGDKTDNNLQNLVGPINRRQHVLTRKYFKNQYGIWENKNVEKKQSKA